MTLNDWLQTDLSDDAARKAFTDWLEEHDYWQAEEIRRLHVQEVSDGFAIFSGAFQVQNYCWRDLQSAKLALDSVVDFLFRGKEVNHCFARVLPKSCWKTYEEKD